MQCFELPTDIHMVNKPSAHWWKPNFHYTLHTGWYL